MSQPYIIQIITNTKTFEIPIEVSNSITIFTISTDEYYINLLEAIMAYLKENSINIPKHICCQHPKSISKDSIKFDETPITSLLTSPKVKNELSDLKSTTSPVNFYQDENNSLGYLANWTSNKSIISNIGGNIEFDVPLVDGKKEGYGRWFHNNGKIKYFGDFVNDGPNGKNVVLYYNNGLIEYHGSMFEGKYHGWGKLWHFNGQQWYDGYFNHGMPDGEDCELYQQKRVIKYKGEIVNGITKTGMLWHRYY